MLQIRRGGMDNLVIFLSICLRRNIQCDPLLGPSCTDGSN